MGRKEWRRVATREAGMGERGYAFGSPTRRYATEPRLSFATRR
jgi:hypothetical protein